MGYRAIMKALPNQQSEIEAKQTAMHTPPHRRLSDRGMHWERRTWFDRRNRDAWLGKIRFPSLQEQSIQFVTRYLFAGLGIAFFNYSDIFTEQWLTLPQINAILILYALINTANFIHAWRHPNSVGRYRLAMWVDILAVGIAVLNDPYGIPPSLLAFIMVVLGNGMRYGMRLFGEALTGCLAAGMIALSIRSMNSSFEMTLGVMFLNLFGAIILIYAYILMSRIEMSRRQLEQSSRLDTLTGLINRGALMEMAESLFNNIARNGGSLVVMFADLDKFKVINDTHGHTVGDRVLQQVAQILNDAIRDADIAARYGGDEFVLMLAETDMERALEIAKRIQARVAAWSEVNRLDISITIGLGEAPIHGSSFAALLECVDKALYKSKACGSASGIQCVGLAGETA